MTDRVLSHYTILERLGEGGMGVVYLARDERLGREVAIKQLRPEAVADAAARERFHTEALALSRLSHSGIATVYEFDREAEADYLVMEYVPGDALSRRIANGPLPESEVADLGAQIADALAAAHAQGVVHRDLKPGNVVVTPDGRVKVLDFGLAKLASAEGDVTRAATAPLAVMGTLAYMAPEQISAGPIGPRTDLYALGAVLYEMATGARPHPEDTLSALVYAIVHRMPQPPRRVRPGLSEALEATILHALAKDPEQRPESAAALAAMLRGQAQAPRPLPADGARIDSILVLPLVNLSGDPAQEFFADGTTEALIASLAHLEGVRVISRTTAMRYKNASRPIAELARELNVQGIVEGSLQRSGDRVRIGAQLVDARADRLLWSGSYEGEMQNLLALQGDVACSVAKEIRGQVAPGERERIARRPAIDPRAQEAYLRGRFHWNRRTEADMRVSIELFQQAIAIAPDYALPHVGLADSYNLLGDMNAILPHEAAVKAKEAVTRALELEPDLGDAYTSLGFLHMFYDWNWSGARRAYTRALELNPGYPTGHQWYSELLVALGQFEAGIAEAHRAMELDPYSPILGTTLGDANFFARRYDDALASLRRTVEIDPTFYQAINDLGRTLSEMGRYDEALASFERARVLSGANPLASVGIGYTLARAGRGDEARRVLTHLESEAERRYVSPHAIAAIHVGLGEHDRAFECLERAYREHDRALVWVRVHPRLDPLRGDPRFRDLERRVMIEA